MKPLQARGDRKIANRMPRVEFHPSGKTVQVPPQTRLLDAARQAGVKIESPCGGDGTCGKCLVRVTGGEVDSRSLGTLPGGCGGRLRAGLRHARSSGRPGGGSAGTGGMAADSSPPITRLTWSGRAAAPAMGIRSPGRQVVVKAEPPQLESGLSDLDRLTRAIQHDWGRQPVEFSLLSIRKLGDTLRAAADQVTATSGARLAAISTASSSRQATLPGAFGLAIDIGTTTCAVQLDGFGSRPDRRGAERLQRSDCLRPGCDRPDQLRAHTRAVGGTSGARAGHYQPADSRGGAAAEAWPRTKSPMCHHRQHGDDPSAAGSGARSTFGSEPYTPTVADHPPRVKGERALARR